MPSFSPATIYKVGKWMNVFFFFSLLQIGISCELYWQFIQLCNFRSSLFRIANMIATEKGLKAIFNDWMNLSVCLFLC